MLILTWESCGLGDQDTKENEIDTKISASIAIPVAVDHVIDTANVAKSLSNIPPLLLIPFPKVPLSPRLTLSKILGFVL